MLIEFSATNYKSIRETQTFSLVASSGKERLGNNTFDPASPSTPRLLRSGVIYGPNAAGKSNLIAALGFVKEFIESSAGGMQRGESISISPFRLDSKTSREPSEFEIVFMEGSIRYQYGFSATSDRVTEEWLYAYPGSRQQQWFSRSFNENAGKYQWYFGPAFKGQKRLLTHAIRSNALFLSTAVQLNNEQLQPIFDWFNDRLIVASGRGQLPLQYEDYTATRCKDELDRQRVAHFLKAADLGIDCLSVKVSKFTEGDFPPDLPDGIRDQLLGREKLQVGFQHEQNETGELVSFSIQDESDGTRNMFALAGPWLDVLDRGFVMVMDELDTSLHPKLVRFLVSMFHSNDTNKNNAQLVFTTHDVTLLEDVFRRDQIWFVEKVAEQQSRVYPLSDFRPRKGEAVARGYLRGRYGALPHVRRMSG
jgi:uncharacterized protein